jgi:hypothetical protein
MQYLRTKNRRQPVPRLRDLLYLMKCSPLYKNISVVILDIKEDNPIPILERTRSLINLVDGLRISIKLNDESCLMSEWKSKLVIGIWDLKFYKYAKMLFDDLPISLIHPQWPPTVNPGNSLPADPWKTPFDNYSLKWGILSSNIVNEIHARNRSIYSWTLNTLSEMRSAVELGLDGILTDNPRYCRCAYRSLVSAPG